MNLSKPCTAQPRSFKYHCFSLPLSHSHTEIPRADLRGCCVDSHNPPICRLNLVKFLERAQQCLEKPQRQHGLSKRYLQDAVQSNIKKWVLVSLLVRFSSITMILKGKAEVCQAKFSQNMEVAVHTSENMLLVFM